MKPKESLIAKVLLSFVTKMIKVDLGTGPLEQFQLDGDPTTQAARWRTWKQSVNIMITAKGVTDAKQKEAILLHVGGIRLQEVYFTLPDLTQEEGNNLDAYEKAIKKLDAYFEPKVNEAYERHKFRKLKQQQGESVAHFVSKLRIQSELCNFNSTAEREKNVRDQLIDGCISDKLKKLLLEKGNELTLDKAINIANSLELVQRQTEIMSESVTTHMAKAEARNVKLHRNHDSGTGQTLMQDHLTVITVENKNRRQINMYIEGVTGVGVNHTTHRNAGLRTRIVIAVENGGISPRNARPNLSRRVRRTSTQ